MTSVNLGGYRLPVLIYHHKATGPKGARAPSEGGTDETYVRGALDLHSVWV